MSLAVTTLTRGISSSSRRAVASVLRQAESWPLRRQAAQTLAEMGPAAADEAVLGTLERAALEDRYALVREAAARALFTVAPQAATRVLERLRDSDAEAQVREAARQMLSRPP